MLFIFAFRSCNLFTDASRHGRPRPARTHIVFDDDQSDPDVGRVWSRPAPSQRLRAGHDGRPPSPSSTLGHRTQRPSSSPPSSSPSSRGRSSRGRCGWHDQRRRGRRSAAPRHGHGSPRTGSVRRAV